MNVRISQREYACRRVLDEVSRGRASPGKYPLSPLPGPPTRVYPKCSIPRPARRPRSNTSSGASLTSGTPGIKPRTNPPRTRKIGYGTSRTSESNTRPATATSNPKTMSSKCSATANSLRSTRPCRCNRAPAASVPPRRPPPTKPRRSRVAGVAPRRPGLRAAQARRTPDAPTPRERG
jgi:hypothetical protein